MTVFRAFSDTDNGIIYIFILINFRVNKMSKKNRKIKNTQHGNDVNAKEKFNFIPWIIILGVILLVLAVFILSDFIGNYHHVRKFSFDYATGELIDKKNDITYIEAPKGYEAVRISNKPYATDGYVEYYQLGFVDSEGKEQLVPTTIALSTSVEEGAYIYYNPKQYDLPTIECLEAKEILVCDMNNNTLQSLDKDKTQTILDAFKDGSDIDFRDYDSIFTIRVRSENIPWMSYCLYLCMKNDVFYIVDDTTNKTVCLSSDVGEMFDTDLLKLFDS